MFRIMWCLSWFYANSSRSCTSWGFFGLNWIPIVSLLTILLIFRFNFENTKFSKIFLINSSLIIIFLYLFIYFFLYNNLVSVYDFFINDNLIFSSFWSWFTCCKGNSENERDSNNTSSTDSSNEVNPVESTPPVIKKKSQSPTDLVTQETSVRPTSQAKDNNNNPMEETSVRPTSQDKDNNNNPTEEEEVFKVKNKPAEQEIITATHEENKKSLEGEIVTQKNNNKPSEEKIVTQEDNNNKPSDEPSEDSEDYSLEYFNEPEIANISGINPSQVNTYPNQAGNNNPTEEDTSGEKSSAEKNPNKGSKPTVDESKGLIEQSEDQTKEIINNSSQELFFDKRKNVKFSDVVERQTFQPYERSTDKHKQYDQVPLAVNEDKSSKSFIYKELEEKIKQEEITKKKLQDVEAGRASFGSLTSEEKERFFVGYEGDSDEEGYSSGGTSEDSNSSEGSGGTSEDSNSSKGSGSKSGENPGPGSEPPSNTGENPGPGSEPEPPSNIGEESGTPSINRDSLASSSNTRLESNLTSGSINNTITDSNPQININSGSNPDVNSAISSTDPNLSSDLNPSDTTNSKDKDVLSKYDSSSSNSGIISIEEKPDFDNNLNSKEILGLACLEVLPEIIEKIISFLMS